jgi:ribose transport system ATP-binding protein
MSNISKSYPGVLALKNASFELRAGEVHALVGENGAGKSTFVKIMTGIIGDYSGDYEYLGEKTQFRSIRDAQQAGISVVHQELNMIGDLTVADNIFIGRESASFAISERELNNKARQLIKEYDIGVSPTALLRELTVAKAQLIEIAKAMSFATTKVMIFDEPTASLSDKEIKDLLTRIERMRAKGIAVVYISHRMNEIMEVSDRITILRDGEYIETLNTSDCTVDDVIRHMVGREVINAPKTHSNVDIEAKAVLSVEHLSSPDVHDISFDLRDGEILGFAGLVGAGRTETMRLICGADKSSSGVVRVHGKPVRIGHPNDAIRAGIAYLSEDRKRYGLVLNLSVVDNIALPSYDSMSRGPVIADAKCHRQASRYVSDLKIKTPSILQLARNLSGGNQQKVVLAKWLLRDVDIFIFDEPTRGIDIGARAEIYDLMLGLVDQGKSIILVSSDLDEVLHLSDRIFVMSEGRKTGELDISEANPVKIMSLATTNRN